MTTTPDPKTVRDFARRAILSAVEDVDYMGIGKAFGEDESWPQGDERFAVCPEGDSDHDEARGLIIEVPETVAALLGEVQQ